MRVLIISMLMLGQLAGAATLRVLNWSDYIDEAFLIQFSQQFNVEVDYVTYEDVDQFDFQFFLSETQFDVVFPPIDSLATMIDRGLTTPLNKTWLPNLKQIDPAQMKRIATYDPGNQFALPYLWGTTGLGINVDKVKTVLGVDDVPPSWALIFDPQYAQKLQACGISWLDSEIEMLPLSLNYIGQNPQSTSRTDFRTAEAHLSQVSPFVRSFTSETYMEPFREGQLCIVVGYSGDIYQAIFEAEESNNGQNLEYVIPKEGTFVWFDPVVITSKENNRMAHEFVNALMDPKNIAGITNYVWYANAVPASLPFIDDDIKEDPSIYPDKETADKLFGYPVYEDGTLRTMTRRWTIVKCAAGQECLVPLEAIPSSQ